MAHKDPFKKDDEADAAHEQSAHGRLHNRSLEVAEVIEQLDIGTLKDASTLTRKHPKKQIKRLMKGIEAFGFLIPILVDASDTVIAGHARLQAAIATGMTSVPAIRVSHLDEVQIRAFRIFDNRIAKLAEWDEEALAQEFQYLIEQGVEIDLTGFEIAEADLIIEAHTPKLHETACDDVPPASARAVSRMGDVFELASHRVACGDARDADFVNKLWKDIAESAANVFTDPPFNLRVDGHISGLGRIKHREFAMASGEMSEDAFFEFLQTFLTVSVRHLRPGALLYVCMDWRHVEPLIAAGRSLDLTLFNICVWAKTNAGMGSFYRSQHEMVVVFKYGAAPHINNIELGKYGRNRSNLWTYEGANSFNATRRQELSLHPTVKPVRLVADALLDCTARGDIVYDPFLGSGSTLIAAEDTGRRCFGVEIDPLYVDVAIRRWQEFTGREAVHVASGHSFDRLIILRAPNEITIETASPANNQTAGNNS